MTKISTAARVAHDLGLAACFGGTLFGKVAFNSSVAVVGSKPGRGKVGGAFWNRANVVNAAAFLTAVATWLPGRVGLSGEGLDGRTRGLVLAKDALMGFAGAVGLAAVVVQIALNFRYPGGAVPLETGGVPAPEADALTSVLQRGVGALGTANVALFAALIAVTTVLPREAERPASRGIVSRALR